MDYIWLGTSGRQTTRLGFGCSGLMGTLGLKESSSLLEAAFDSGICHFDAAPMYGFGQVEACLGQFLKRHRSEVTVTTKYGIPAPKHQALIAVARRFAQPAVRAFPGLRRRLSTAAARATSVTERAAFTSAEAKASLYAGLKALGTDRLDVWLLHEAEHDDLRDDSLLRLFQDLIAAGTIGTFGVGSERRKIEALLSSRPEYCPTLQFEWSAVGPPASSIKAFRIHHRTLTSNFKAIHATLSSHKPSSAAWSLKADADLADTRVVASLMLKIALIENPESVILFSSKNPAHIRHNVEVAGDKSLVEPARRFYALLQSSDHFVAST